MSAETQCNILQDACMIFQGPPHQSSLCSGVTESPRVQAQACLGRLRQLFQQTQKSGKPKEQGKEDFFWDSVDSANSLVLMITIGMHSPRCRRFWLVQGLVSMATDRLWCLDGSHAWGWESQVGCPLYGADLVRGLGTGVPLFILDIS